ncbi:hypothetical protein Ae201684P_007728 [Aphanomyces euteiches]|nr:hypothetical protein Ae201684P_007728 [Aphanomyces euteiches]
MRNLVVFNEQHHELPNEEPSSWMDMTIDPELQRVWCLTSTGRLVAMVDDVVVLEVELPPQSDWTWCVFHAELDGIVCASRTSCLAIVRYPDVEVIGHFDFGICGMAWSPNEEQLALVTGDGHFLVMNTTWDVLQESTCSPSPLQSEAQLSWRADGKFLSIQGFFTDDKSLQVQVWEVENAVWKLHAVGRHEDKKPLKLQGSALSWAPNHTLIASCEQFKNQNHVVFFERNGYRHGEFVLAKDLPPVTQLTWNLSSDILAVAAESVVQLWTRSNYHWYLKQERRFASTAVASMQWDLEQPNVLHVLTKDGQYIFLEVAWQVHANAAATVAVIDGTNVKVTHCAKAMIPPPMAAETHEFSHAINEVAVLNDCVIVVGDSVGQWFQIRRPSQIVPLKLDSPRFIRNVHATLDSSSIVGISIEEPDVLVTIDLDTAQVKTTRNIDAISSTSLDGQHIQLKSKEMPCLLTEWVVIDSSLVVGLSKTKLFVNSHLLHSSIASFHIARGCIMATTLGSHPEFHLYQIKVLQQGEYTPEYKRPVERGAKIVTSTTTDVFLQMPRGNIEGIAPRPLLLALLQEQLQKTDYASALEVCRKHRIDMNLLVDVNPTAFLENAQSLIQSIPERIRCDRLSLFITNLHPIDVCATKYPALQAVSQVDSTFDKVLEVCKALRDGMVSLDPSFYLIPLLTCEAKMNLLEDALQRIQKAEAKIAQKGLKHLVFLVDAEVLYDVALGLYDINLTRLVASYTERDPKVYTPQLVAFEALGTSHSTRYMHYSIDMELKRFEKALENLHAAGETYHSQCLDLIRTHHLYDKGLTIFASTSYYPEIVTKFGQYLVQQKEFHQAGYTFLSIRKIPEAVDAFRKALDWKMALALVPQVPTLSVPTVAYAMAEELLQQNDPKYSAAARIYIDYCQDIDEGIATFVTGRLYQEALQQALLHQRSDLVETDVQPAVDQAAEELLEEYTSKLETYKKNWSRLTTLRDQIRLFRLHGIDGKTEAVEGNDAASSAASALSQSSISSVGSHNSNRDIKFGMLDAATQGAAITSSFYASSVSNMTQQDAPTLRKKMPRRFRRTKIQEGSAEEDAYVEKNLLDAIPTDDQLMEAKALMQLLLYFGQVKVVRKIQLAIRQCLDHMASHPPPAPVHGEAKEFVLPSNESWTVLSPSI